MVSDNGRDGKDTKKLFTRHSSDEGMRVKEWPENLPGVPERDISMLQLAPEGQDLMESDPGGTQV